MPKPLFTYRIYCDACEGREITSGIPQTKAAIEEIRKDHAAWHERILREAREKSEAAIAAAETCARCANRDPRDRLDHGHVRPDVHPGLTGDGQAKA